jgi:T4 RnlA family RNA ligase
MLLQFPHKSLFQKLTFLKTDHHPVFDYKDNVVGEHIFRIFTYNLANYKSFTLDAALECRGITFEINEKGEFLRLASLPMQKFFNYNENPFTSGLENEKISLAMDKQDGSLISSCLINGKVHLKSKGAFFSEQAVAANKLLATLPELEQALLAYEVAGYTVNLEYTAPDNQIVLVYQEAGLAILNVRCRENGEYVSFDDIQAPHEFIVKVLDIYKGMTLSEVAEIVYPMEDIEGLVVMTEKGHWVKFKTNWYCERHNAVSKFSPFGRKGRKELIYSVLEERVDDIRQLLVGNTFMLDIINTAEQFVVDYLEDVDVCIEDFLSSNKDLAPRDFFEKAKEEFKDDPFKRHCLLKTKSGHLNSIQEQMKIFAHGSKLTSYNKLFESLKNNEE